MNDASELELSCDLRSTIRTGIIDYDHFQQSAHVGSDALETAAKVLFLIVRGNDQTDIHVRCLVARHLVALTGKTPLQADCPAIVL